eukprot:1642107-Pyramimonas_sp.AAC.1
MWPRQGPPGPAGHGVAEDVAQTLSKPFLAIAAARERPVNAPMPAEKSLSTGSPSSPAWP